MEACKTLNGSKDSLLAVPRKSKDNLLYQQIINRINEQVLSQGNRELDALEQSLLKLKSLARMELESISANPDLKISKMVSSLTEKEIGEVELQTERLSKYELGEKVFKDPKGGRDRKEIAYQKINPLIKNINILSQRHVKIKEVLRKALKSTKFELKLPESEFMNRVFPSVVKHLDNDDVLEFGQNRINEIAQDIGNARIRIFRENGTITLSIESDNQEDIVEARELIGI